MIDFAACFTHNGKVQVMRRMLLLITMLLGLVTTAFAQSDYYIKKAQSYQREAEYYQKRAEGYRREAAYYLKKAEGYQREAPIIPSGEI